MFKIYILFTLSLFENVSSYYGCVCALHWILNLFTSRLWSMKFIFQHRESIKTERRIFFKLTKKRFQTSFDACFVFLPFLLNAISSKKNTHYTVLLTKNGTLLTTWNSLNKTILGTNYTYLFTAVHFVWIHCDLKVSRFQAKVYENFANFFLNNKANIKCFL